MTAVGLCGSDRHWLVDGGIGDDGVDAPIVPGHEFAGIVESGPQRGRRVTVDPCMPCGRCEPCRTGAVHLCVAMRFAGLPPTDGALREYVAWPEAALHPVPDSIDDVAAALIEPLAIAIHAVERAGNVAGATVGVIGCGPIGLLIVAVARVAGVAASSRPTRWRTAGMLPSVWARPTSWPRHRRVTSDPSSSGRPGDAGWMSCSRPPASNRPWTRRSRSPDRAARSSSSGSRPAIGPLSRPRSPAARSSRSGSAAARPRRTPDGRSASRATARSTCRVSSALCVGLRDARRGFDSLVARDGIKVIIRPDTAA